MKTKEEIQKEVEALKAVRPRVVPRSIFGTDNLAQLDAAVRVLEEDMDNDDIFDAFDCAGMDVSLLSAALDARQWLEGEDESESMAEDYPMKPTEG